MKARVPEDRRIARTKPEIALAETDRIRTAGVRFAMVLADAGYGLSAPFRQGLDARGLKWAVGIPKQQKVYPNDVKLTFPRAGRGPPRKRPIPDQLSAHAEEVLAKAKWRRIGWRKGTKGPLAASFAAVRIRIADGPEHRIHDKGAQHMPGEEAWLVGERRASGERQCYLASPPSDAGLRTLAAAIKTRWVCEQAHQQLKEEFGLDHFEGRSWHDLHRHALMTMIAYAYLQSSRLAEERGVVLWRPSTTANANRSRGKVNRSPLVFARLFRRLENRHWRLGAQNRHDRPGSGGLQSPRRQRPAEHAAPAPHTAKAADLPNAWLGREDSNLRMAESKSAALPLGYAPTRRTARRPGGKRTDHSSGCPAPQWLDPDFALKRQCLDHRRGARTC